MYNQEISFEKSDYQSKDQSQEADGQSDFRSITKGTSEKRFHTQKNFSLYLKRTPTIRKSMRDYHNNIQELEEHASYGNKSKNKKEKIIALKRPTYHGNFSGKRSRGKLHLTIPHDNLSM